MDIKVITRHAQSNYGSLLQAIATQTVLERLGHRCEIIDYLRDDEHGLDGVLTYLRNKPAWNKTLFHRSAFVAVRYTDEKLAELKFARMRSRYLHMTRRFSRCDDLGQLEADVFMTGSDQVWGGCAERFIRWGIFSDICERSAKGGLCRKFRTYRLHARHSERLQTDAVGLYRHFGARRFCSGIVE